MGNSAADLYLEFRTSPQRKGSIAPRSIVVDRSVSKGVTVVTRFLQNARQRLCVLGRLATAPIYCMYSASGANRSRGKNSDVMWFYTSPFTTPLNVFSQDVRVDENKTIWRSLFWDTRLEFSYDYEGCDTCS